ncbi:type III-A CRISPR-associated RAMP protein Csm3 [Vulcanisaeta sp. JCM 14467]
MAVRQYLSPQLRLVGIFELKFKLINETGFLIRNAKAREIMGAADVEPMSIYKQYSIDNKNYSLRVPYIPGSSLKGRARSLLELALGLSLSTTDGKIYYHMRVGGSNQIIHDDPYCPVDNVFGSMSIQPKDYQPGEEGPHPYAWLVEKCWAPTRAIFRDIYPSGNYVKKLCDEKDGCNNVTFEDFLEEKSENRIDRVTSAADPRTILRVKPDVEFEGSISFLVFDLDMCRRRECEEHSKLREYIRDYPARYYLQSLVDALMLVEETYIGGSGTRGYGNVKFRDIVLSLHNLAANEPAPRELGRFRDLRELRDFIDKMTVFDDIKKIVCGST